MARKKKQSEDLSIAQIEEQIGQIDIDRQRLEAALKERRKADIREFVESLRQQIAERGFSSDEVVALLTGRKRTASKRRNGAKYARYVDPENPANSYVRGPIPRWLGEKMIEAGFDPANKDHRDEFKETHLQKAA